MGADAWAGSSANILCGCTPCALEPLKAFPVLCLMDSDLIKDDFAWVLMPAAPVTLWIQRGFAFVGALSSIRSLWILPGCEPRKSRGSIVRSLLALNGPCVFVAAVDDTCCAFRICLVHRTPANPLKEPWNAPWMLAGSACI